jgi:hypothetical protein
LTQINLFIRRSKNKSGGTGNIAEHHLSPVVVGAGNAKHVRRSSMTNRFMISVAAAALIAGTGFANAQGTGMSREAPSGSTVQQSAPSSERAAPSAAPTNRDATESTKPSSGMKATQSEDKAAQPGGARSQRAQDDMKAGPKSEKSAQDNNMKGEKSAQDNIKGEKSKSMSSETEKGATKDMKAEGREGRDRNNMNAEQKGATDRTDSKSQTTTQSQTNQSQTTGQAGAGAKLSTEQRTKITTVIKSQRVEPLKNVNFSISVGTRVPRDVRFHALPAEVVTVYPEWRGYEFILVNDQIIVVDPRTFEIVAVLDA